MTWCSRLLGPSKCRVSFLELLAVTMRFRREAVIALLIIVALFGLLRREVGTQRTRKPSRTRTPRRSIVQ